MTVTSRPPLETEIGKKNLSNFIDSGFDHVHVTPNQKAMKQLNKLGFIEKGSPYYGWLVSIFSVVIKVALQNNVNLIFIVKMERLNMVVQLKIKIKHYLMYFT